MSSECERGPLTTSTVDYWVQHVVFPCQVFILTLVIYDIARNATSVKSRIVAKPNLLVLALLNLLVFGTMLPQSLGSFSWFFEAESFRRFFHYSKIPINALSNLISAMEIFITLAICVECYLRSKSSSLVKCFVPSVRYVTFLVGAFIMSAGLTGYHFLLYELETGYRCNGTKLVVRIKMLSFLPFLYDLIPSLYEWGFPNVITVMNSVLMSGKLAALAISSHMCQELGRLGVSTY
ncbi:hypothetical protein NECAME_11525 [Necator americanus]|uniref:Serpentine receptor class gamma n=1 Tax=Necator americanus TaxID=51031 RepID=W2T4X3_NECAM|nr:hypothetical protein NECAME_11525 [Necator americanus]ETN76639.1 hypothetical protein NECAME_11525 [Necator americanus]